MKEEKELLIVDDHLEICMLLEHIFQALNIKTYAATTIEETNRILSRIYPQSILLDNNLPDGLGFHLIPQIKTIFPNTRIIAMSALNISKAKEQAFNAGADDFLEKPFSVSQVYKIISDNYFN